MGDATLLPNDSALSPLQAVVRFAIEIAALVCWGIIGWQLGTTPAVRWVLMICFVLAAGTVWGTFRAPGDQSASGATPVPVPGVVRLTVELDVLLGAAILTAVVWRPVVGAALGVAVIIHYAATLRRVRWLIARRSTGTPAGRA